MKKKDITEAFIDSEVQQKDPKSAGSRGLEFVSKKIEATKKINHPIVKNKVDQNKK